MYKLDAVNPQISDDLPILVSTINSTHYNLITDGMLTGTTPDPGMSIDLTFNWNVEAVVATNPAWGYTPETSF